MKKVCWMTLKCSAEPKRRYVAQIAVFSAEAEPIWRRNKISPQAARMRFSVSVSRFSLCPARCVSRYSEQGLCVPQKSNHSQSRQTLWGRSPKAPERRDAHGERCSYRRPGDGNRKREDSSKGPKMGLNTTEYVKQRALGYEPRAVPPDALFACLEKLGELADKASSPELVEEIGAVLKQITAEFLLPGKG